MKHVDPDLITNGDTRNVVDKYKYWAVEAIKDDLAKSAFPFHVAIENFQHDFNIGTIVRNANAFRVAGVHIIGKRHWNSRGAMSTQKYLQLYHHVDVESFIAWASLETMEIIGVDNTADSVSIQTTSLPPQAVYVFGQEGPGLSSEMQKACAKVVKIDQYGSTRSVNVGVASGIVMYEWVRQNHLSKQI